MKNIIKRGTSLLLVLAMLLSFAAVVGAADERLPAEGEKPVTLSLDSVVLRQGSTDVQYVPVRLTIEPGFAITGFQLAAVSSDESAVEVTGFYPKRPLKIYEDGSVNYDETIGTIFGKLYSNYGSSESKDPVQKFACANGKGVTSETISTRAEDGVIKEPDLAGYIGVKVKDGAQSGAYQLSIIPNASRDRDTTKRNDIVFTIGTQNTYTDAYATLNAGTAIVLPEGASLPTVILTDDTFAVPTWVQMKAGEDIYPLAGRMKIVGTDGKLYAVDPTTLTVEKDSVPTGVSVKNNQLEILTSTLRNDDTLTGTGTLRVTNAKAVGADISVTSATVSFKVNRAPAVATHVGFGYSGYNPVPADATPREAESKTAENVQFNLGYGSLGVFDQYSDSIPGLTPTVDLKLYSDAFQTELQPEDEVITAKQVTMGTSTLTISKDLKKDVWCEIKTSWTNSDGSKTITGDTVKVHITSNYPQPKKAIISLTDGNNHPFSGDNAKGTFDIPGGSGETTIKFAVDKFLDKKNNEEMKGEAVPTDYTVAATQTSPATPADDVTISIDSDGKTGTITVGSGAVKSAPVEIEIKVTLADNTELTGILKVGTKELPAKITLKKGDSRATALKLYKDGQVQSGTEIEVGGLNASREATLPGIGETLRLTFSDVCVVDQYGESMGKLLSSGEFWIYRKADTTLGETADTLINSGILHGTSENGGVWYELTNYWDKDADDLGIKAGTYYVVTKSTYVSDFAQLKSADFTLSEGETKLSGTPIYYDVKTGDEPTLYLPYKYGTLDSAKTTTMKVGAAIKTQYGRAYASSELPVYALRDVKLNGKAIENNAVTWTNDSTGITFTVDKSAAQLFGTSNTATLTAEMTVTVGEKSTPSIPISITIKKEASELSAVKVEMAEDTAFTTGLRTWSANRTSESKEGEVTLLSPNAKKTWYIRRTAENQYGVEMDIVALITTPKCSWSNKTDPATGKTLYSELGVPAGFEESFVMQFTNFTKEYKFTAKFVPMEFVKSETGKNDTFQLSDYLTNDTFSAEYNGQPWSTILTTKPNAKVYIKTAEGENNTEIPSDKLTLEVTKDGEAVGMDAKANAGTYKVKLVYTDNNQTYTVDEKTFTITPKTVKITANGTITKEYNGSPALPAGVTLTIEGNPADLTVDPNALQYESADASTAAINIVLAANQTTCLTGDAAINYNVSLDGLTGTITPRKLIVTPKAKTFEYGENDKITTALTTEFDYAGKNGDLPSGLTPSFTGSMVLTQSNAEVQSPYNAGDYYPRQGTLAVNSNNYEISEFKTTVNGTEIKWVVSPKTVDPFDVTLQAEYGINGSELYAMLNTAKVTVDGKEVNLSTVYNVNVLDIEDAGKNKVSRTGTDAVNAGEYTVTNWTLTTLGKNYTFNKVPTLKIKVKPHVLADADVQFTGDDGATFDGTEKSVMVKVSFTYGGRKVTLTKDTDYTLTGTVKTANAGGHSFTVTAKPNGNLSGSVQKDWQIWSYSISPSDITFKQTSTSSYTYNGSQQELQKSDVTWTVTTTDTTKKAFLKQYFAANDFYLHDYSRTDAGNHTAIAMLTGNFVATRNSGPFTIPWKIKQSKVHTISNQTSSTKYGQPGSLTVTLSEGQYKGLTNGAWTVRDIGDIFESAVAEYKDGVVTINWKLKDTTKAGDTGSFKVTVPASTNYEGYEFTVTVKVTAKDAQTGFGFTYANPIVGYAEDTYTNPVQNAKTTPVYTSSNESVATVDSNGVVTIKDVGENVTITATAPENGEYASATASYTLTVVPSTLTVTASSATMTANDSVPSFTASVTGLKRGQTTAQVFQTLTASAATDGKTAGTYAVNASATLKTDFVPRYTLRFVPGTLTVNPAVSVIDTVLPTIIAGNGCANGYANCACESFYDLDASRWYHEAIDWAYSLGLMNGTTKSTFGPNAAATRAQTWTMLARIAGQDTRRSSTWYEVGQKWAMNLGITDGTNPMGSLTREQLAAMLYRYVGSPAVNGTLTFTDSANVSTWARNAMIWAVQNGILDGVGGNRLNPKGTTTRAQAAAIFMRFSKLINK